MSQEVTYSPNAAGVLIPSVVSTASAASVNTAVSTPATNAGPASTFELKTNNPYSSQGNTGDADGTSEAASQAAAAAGLPYVAPNVVTQIYNQTRGDSSMQQLQQQMLFFAGLNGNTQGGSTGNAGNGGNGGNGGGGAQGAGNNGGIPGQNGAGTNWGPANFSGQAGPLAFNSAIPQLSASARAAVNATGQNVWALVIVALKGAMQDQNSTLQYDLNKLQMYGKMSDQMAQYAQLLDQTQDKLDQAIQNQTNDSKKQNQTVDMPVQWSFGPSTMFTLDNNGNMLATNIATSENSQNNKNPVTATDLNTKLQIFQQQRDQLQKNIDHWTNQYQSDNEVKNQLTTTITSILKNMYDMQSAVTRNINL